MARRVSAADLTEDSFELGHSGFSGDDTAHTNEQLSGLPPANADESVSIDYFSDFSDLDQLAEIEYGNIDGGGVDDENDDRDEPGAVSYNDHVDDSIDELAEDGSLEDQAFDDLDFSDSSIEDENSGDEEDYVEDQTVEDESNAGDATADAYVDINDDAIEDDDLEFLGQHDFSSPSILNNSPSRRPPARVSSQVVLDSDDDDDEGIFHTRRQADPGPFHLVSSLPQNPSTGTPSRPRTTGAGSITFPSPPATNMSSGARSSTKRRRSNDAGVGPSGTALPPISSILASVGNGSSSSASSSRAAGSLHGDSQASSSSGSGANNAASQSSRPRISPKRPRCAEPIILDDDLFGSDDDDTGIEMINLVDVDRPEAAKPEVTAKEEKASQKEEPAPAPKNLTKLSAQQCVICMDDMTDITVTHCGHLFCGECLFSSLHSTDQRICPICRTKIELRTPSMSAAKMTRSFFPLQLKMRPRR